MRCFAIVILMISVLLPGISSADMSGRWTIRDDVKINGKLDPTKHVYTIHFNSDGDIFSGNYIGIDNDSTFDGQEWTCRKTTVIQFKQTDQNYSAVYAGSRIGPNHFRGTWYDCAGNSGEFDLKRQ